MKLHIEFLVVEIVIEEQHNTLCLTVTYIWKVLLRDRWFTFTDLHVEGAKTPVYMVQCKKTFLICVLNLKPREVLQSWKSSFKWRRVRAVKSNVLTLIYISLYS